MDEKILEIMRSVFGTQDVTTQSSQTNCDKWDSLRHLNLIVELEDAFELEFEPEEIAEMKSFDVVKACLEKKLSE